MLLLGGGSAYAGCTVNGVTEKGAISKTDLTTAIATGTDDVTTCNVSSITSMSYLFNNADAFNQDIGDWNVSSVTTMYAMFRDATVFNQDISDWNVSSVTDMKAMFFRAGLSTQNYHLLLIDWNALTLQNNVTFNAGNSKYNENSTAATARANIISKNAWNIIDGRNDSPADKKDVIGSIEAWSGIWSGISSRWADSSIESAFNRIDWLKRNQDPNQTSHQGIKLSFLDTLIDKIMNNSPGKALSDIDAVDTAASLIENSDGSASEVGDNAVSEASNIAINEAVRLREDLVGSLNPSFGPVIGNWSMWTEGKIVIGKTSASTTASKKEIDVQSISLGFDKPVGDDELIGFVLSIGQDNTDIGTALTNVKSDNYSLSNYNVLKLSSNILLENVLGLGHLEFDTIRTDSSDTLTGKRKAKQLFLSTTLRPEEAIIIGNWKVSPYSKLTLANTRLNGFSESGASTALTFNKQKIRDAGLSVGMDINSSVTINNTTINPYAKVEYDRSSSKTLASMHYNNEDASMYLYTSSFNKQINNWKLKLGADLTTGSGWDSSIRFTREQPFGSGQSSKYLNSFSFNASIKF